MKPFKYLLFIFFFFYLIIASSSQAGNNDGPGCSVDMNIETTHYDSVISSKDIETEISTQKGQKRWIAVVAQNVSNLDAYQFDLLYDKKQLEYIGCVEEDQMTFDIQNILKKNGGETIGFTTAVEPGKINIGNTMIGKNEQEAPEGSGILAIIGFKVLTSCPKSELILSNIIFIDVNDNEAAIQNISHGSIENKCDINSDGKLNLPDVITILRQLAGFE